MTVSGSLELQAAIDAVAKDPGVQATMNAADSDQTAQTNPVVILPVYNPTQSDLPEEPQLPPLRSLLCPPQRPLLPRLPPPRVYLRGDYLTSPEDSEIDSEIKHARDSGIPLIPMQQLIYKIRFSLF